MIATNDSELAGRMRVFAIMELHRIIASAKHEDRGFMK